EVQPASQIVSGLRAAARDAVRDAAGQWIRSAGIILGRVLEERCDVAPGSEADTEDIWIFRRIHHLIELGRVEAALEADLHRQPGQRHRRVESAAAAEFPIRGRYRRLAGDDTLLRFVIARDEGRSRRVQGRRQIRHRIRLHDERLRSGTGAVDDATEDGAGDRRAVRIPGDRDLQPVIACSVHRRAYGGAELGAHARVIALPCAGQPNVAEGALHAVYYDRPAAIGDVVPQ